MEEKVGRQNGRQNQRKIGIQKLDKKLYPNIPLEEIKCTQPYANDKGKTDVLRVVIRKPDGGMVDRFFYAAHYK